MRDYCSGLLPLENGQKEKEAASGVLLGREMQTHQLAVCC